MSSMYGEIPAPSRPVEHPDSVHPEQDALAKSIGAMSGRPRGPSIPVKKRRPVAGKPVEVAVSVTNPAHSACSWPHTADLGG